MIKDYSNGWNDAIDRSIEIIKNSNGNRAIIIEHLEKEFRDVD